jgi:hypothetical protein
MEAQAISDCPGILEKKRAKLSRVAELSSQDISNQRELSSDAGETLVSGVNSVQNKWGQRALEGLRLFTISQRFS